MYIIYSPAVFFQYSPSTGTIFVIVTLTIQTKRKYTHVNFLPSLACVNPAHASGSILAWYYIWDLWNHNTTWMGLLARSFTPKYIQRLCPFQIIRCIFTFNKFMHTVYTYRKAEYSLPLYNKSLNSTASRRNKTALSFTVTNVAIGQYLPCTTPPIKTLSSAHTLFKHIHYVIIAIGGCLQHGVGKAYDWFLPTACCRKLWRLSNIYTAL